MTYIRVQWEHDSRADQVWIYSEPDAGRWWTRKVEVTGNATAWSTNLKLPQRFTPYRTDMLLYELLHLIFDQLSVDLL